MRKVLFGATLSAMLVLVACAPEVLESTFPIAEYMDQAFGLYITDDSYSNWSGANLILDFNGGQSGANAIIPDYITDLPTIDGQLAPDEPWYPGLGAMTWHTISLEHKPYASGFGDDTETAPDNNTYHVNAPSSGVVDEVDFAVGFNVAAGVGTIYMAFQWTDPYGSDDHYSKRWRFYRDVNNDGVAMRFLRQVENGWDPMVAGGAPDGSPVDPEFWGTELYNHGYSSDTLLLVWDRWQDPDGVYDPDKDTGQDPPLPSVSGFWENGWDVAWQQDGDTWVCKLTADMGNEGLDPQLDLWWWKSTETNNWWPTEVQEYGYADDYWQTADASFNDHGPIPDAGFPCYRYNWTVKHMTPTMYYERPLFKHQDQPKYLYWPNNPEWIYMEDISWGAQGPDQFGPVYSGGYSWHQGDEIPGYASLASTLGSTGDVLAKGILDESTGVWTVELKRLFDPGNDDDANLAQFDY